MMKCRTFHNSLETTLLSLATDVTSLKESRARAEEIVDGTRYVLFIGNTDQWGIGGVGFNVSKALATRTSSVKSQHTTEFLEDTPFELWLFLKLTLLKSSA